MYYCTGNLGRATYESSSNLLWPWSFDECDRSKQRAQMISACDITTHYALNPGQGRGATEIDILEIMAGEPGSLGPETPIQRPYVSMTLQVRVRVRVRCFCLIETFCANLLL